MILINSVIKTKCDFKSKQEIKRYLYSFIEFHPFRKYNQKIADEFGEHLFSMTFILPNLVVLTQRYPTKKLYFDSELLRKDVIHQLTKIVYYYKVSDPIEVET
jgi:hypothetical protein